MRNRYHTIASSASALIISSLLFFGCGGESKVEEIIEERGDGFQSYQLDLRSESIPFSDLIDKIEITRLEETEESLLSYVRQIEFSDDRMVIPSGNESNIYVFFKTGEFLNKINRKGEGPEEYTSYNDVWLEGDTLALYNYRKSINRYDLKGNFISSDRMLEQAAHLYPYRSGYVMDMNYRVSKDTLMFSLITLGEDFKIDKTFLPFTKAPDFWVSFSASSIISYEDDILYFPMMSDTVYKVEADTVAPFIHYDFQDDWFLQPGVEITGAIMDEAEKNEQVWYMHNKIGQNYIYLVAGIGTTKNAAFLIDRRTSKIVRIDFRTTSTEEYQMPSIAWHGDEFLASLQSSQLEELLGQLDESQYSFTAGSTLEEIESSENPVLIRMKIKQSKDW